MDVNSNEHVSWVLDWNRSADLSLLALPDVLFLHSLRRNRSREHGTSVAVG